MGSNHVRALSRLDEIHVAGVVDVDLQRAQALADRHGTSAFASVEDLLTCCTPGRDLHGCVVATPTLSHLPIASQLIEAGVAVLVEKPAAASAAEAQELGRLSESYGVPMMVGHIERFNPVVRELAGADFEGPTHIDIRRVGPFTPRIHDDVVVDLMIHDLDIVRFLTGSNVVDVQAVGKPVLSEVCDLAVALLTLESGTTVSLMASRLGQKKQRQLDLTFEDHFVRCDLLHQSVLVQRGQQGGLTTEGFGFQQTMNEEIRYLENRAEPLVSELSAFVATIRSGDTPPVTIADGVEALRQVERVRAVIGKAIDSGVGTGPLG